MTEAVEHLALAGVSGDQAPLQGASRPRGVSVEAGLVKQTNWHLDLPSTQHNGRCLKTKRKRAIVLGTLEVQAWQDSWSEVAPPHLRLDAESFSQADMADALHVLGSEIISLRLDRADLTPRVQPGNVVGCEQSHDHRTTFKYKQIQPKYHQIETTRTALKVNWVV